MKKNAFYSIALLLIFSIFSCTSEEIFEDFESPINANGRKTCKLVLNVDKESFDDEMKTRSVTSWEEGDKIYLTFSTETGNTYGDAIYKDGEWIVSYYGSLTEGVMSNCIAVYFDTPQSESNTVVLINEETGIYEDVNGQYVFENDTLSVTATLSPKTGRLRFASENSKDSVTIYGLQYYTSYDAATGKYSSSTNAIKKKATSGFTPYIYGSFSDTIQPRLNILMPSCGYTRFFPTSIYKKGESGYIDIPTEASHDNWKNTLIFKINGVEFTMIPVEYSEGFFFMAETETTQHLYYAVINNTTTQPLYPKQMSDNSSWVSWVERLNKNTGLKFYIPTSSEWQHAYKGGDRSNNYLYSGSNTISDVAWYSSNSGNERHEVKLKQPNELGFYDMCGNVAEITIRSKSSSSYDYYGGDYSESSSYCLVNSYDSQNYVKGGLRLALKQ